MTSNSKDIGEFKEHLLNIEARLDRLSASRQLSFDSLSPREDEIDLREIWDVFWGGKLWILGITFLFAIGSVVYVLSLPNQYKSEVVLAPAQEKNGGMGSLAAQYGGLAAMAGINLGGGQSSDVDQAIALVKSWPFLDEFVENYDLKPLVIAVERWDRGAGKVVFDENLYNEQTGEWVREAAPGRPSEPTSYEVYKAMSKMISLSHDAKTNLITLSVEHYIPEVAHRWSLQLIQELNHRFQVRDIQRASQSIEYLRNKINETSIAEMQAVFYRMIEAQMKTLMLAEVSDEYLLKVVVPPKVAEQKSNPKRALICVLATVLGVILGTFWVLVRFFLKRTRRSNTPVSPASE